MENVHPYLWVGVSIAAACFQTLRFMLQKVLSTASLTPTGATFARFAYSAPVVAVLMALYLARQGIDFPVLSPLFWFFALMGGCAQIIATVCLVTLFKYRNFAVGVTLIKTEVIWSVVIGLILLGDAVSLLSLAAIGFGLLGVMILSAPPQTQGWSVREMLNKGTALGLTSGILFGVSAVSYRGASLEIGSDDPVVRAGVTLAIVTGLQMIGMGMWFAMRDPLQIGAVWRARKVAVWIGLLSLAGSFCWFFAFTLQSAAYVKAVGQVELVLSMLVSTLFFRERSTSKELWGIVILCASIVCLVLVA